MTKVRLVPYACAFKLLVENSPVPASMNVAIQGKRRTPIPRWRWLREQPVSSQLGQRFLSLLKNTESRFDPLRDLPLVVDWMPAPTKYPRIEDVALVQRRVILIPILAIFHTTIRWTLTHFMSLKRRREIAGSASRALQGRARASICAQDVGSGKKRSRLVVPRNAGGSTRYRQN